MKIYCSLFQMNDRPTGWHGNLELIYSERNGETQLTRTFAQAPLKVQRPFYPEGKATCHSVILHTAGGIVGGDSLCQRLTLQANASALITTAAAGKIYRSNGKLATQTTHINVESGGYLEWLPQETIVFKGAIYQQDMRIELAEGATCLAWEIVRFGRSARGEQFLEGEWRSSTEIWQAGKPLWIDRQWLPGGEALFNSPNGLAGKPLTATLVWAGKTVSQEIIEEARSYWQVLSHQGEAGVTQLQGGGLLCRYRGTSTAEVRDWFLQVWQLLRQACWQRPTIKPRVWLLKL